MQFAGIGKHGLPALAAAAIPRCLLLLLVEIMIYLGIQHPFCRRLLEIARKSIGIKYRAGI